MGFWDSLAQGAGDVLTLGGGYFNRKANEQQAADAREALNMQIAEQERIDQMRQIAARNAQNLIAQEGLGSLDTLKKYSSLSGNKINDTAQRSINALTGGSEQAQQVLLGQYGDTLRELTGGYGTSRGQLDQGYQQAGSELLRSQQGYQQALNKGLIGGLNEIQQGLSDSRLAGLVSEYTPSKDYAFKKQQGEQALYRANAARGGRSGGAALKQLADFNQQLASDDYNKWANQQQAIRSAYDSQQMGAAQQIANQYSNIGNQLASGQQNLASQLAGLTSGTGQQLGNLAYGYGGQQASMLSELGQDLSGLTTNTAGNMANIYNQQGLQQSNRLSGLGANIANTNAQNISNQANLLMGNAAQNSALTQAMLPYYQMPTQYAGQELASTAQNLGSAANNLATLGFYRGF